MTESSTDPHEDLTDALAAIVADLPAQAAYAALCDVLVWVICRKARDRASADRQVVWFALNLPAAVDEFWDDYRAELAGDLAEDLKCRGSA